MDRPTPPKEMLRIVAGAAAALIVVGWMSLGVAWLCAR
jgi:hypothetical protein